MDAQTGRDAGPGPVPCAYGARPRRGSHLAPGSGREERGHCDNKHARWNFIKRPRVIL